VAACSGGSRFLPLLLLFVLAAGTSCPVHSGRGGQGLIPSDPVCSPFTSRDSPGREPTLASVGSTFLPLIRARDPPMDTALVLAETALTAGFVFLAPRRGCGAGGPRIWRFGPAAQSLSLYLLLANRFQEVAWSCRQAALGFRWW